jgi:hypothetical protein
MADGVTEEATFEPVAEAMAYARQAAVRLRHQTTDMFVPPEARLSDRQRSLWTNLLVGLLDSLEVALRQGMIEASFELPGHAAEQRRVIGEFPHTAAQHIYDDGPTLREPGLVDLLRRRAEEHRMALKLGSRSGADPSDDVVIRLIRSADPEISRLTMEMLVAESRRLDRFREPMIHVVDLPANVAEDVVWWAAAVLRRHLDGTISNVDALLVPAARRLIAERDDTRDDESATMAVVKRLAENGELDDQFLIDALRTGRIGLFVGGLAVRGGVTRTLVWTLVESSSAGLARYLKAVGIAREAAVRLLVEIASLADEVVGRTAPDSIGAAIGYYDRMDSADARRILDYWRTDAGLRKAIEAPQWP